MLSNEDYVMKFWIKQVYLSLAIKHVYLLSTKHVFDKNQTVTLQHGVILVELANGSQLMAFN